MTHIKRAYITVFSIVLYCLILISSSIAQESKVLKYGWGGQWPPFWEKAETGELTGFDIDILNAAAADAGFTVSFTTYKVPWARNMHSIKTGFLDIASSALKTEEREKYAYFTTPYRRELVGLYFHKENVDNYEINVIEDLLKYKKIRIGTELGCSYGDRIDSVFKKLGDGVKEVSDYDSKNWQKLTRRRIDCYLGYPTYENTIKDSGELVLHKMPLIETGVLHFMLSKKTTTKERFQAFDLSLKKILAGEEYKAITEKYRTKYGIKRW